MIVALGVTGLSVVVYCLYYFYGDTKPEGSHNSLELNPPLLDDITVASTIKNGELAGMSVYACLKGGNLAILHDDQEKKYYLYDTEKGKGVYIDSGKHLNISKSEKYLLVVTEESSLDFYDIQQQKLVNNVASNVGWRACSFSPQDTYLAITTLPTTQNSTYQLCLYKTKELVTGQKGNPIPLYDSLVGPHFSPNDEYIYIEDKFHTNRRLVLYRLKNNQGEMFTHFDNYADGSFSKSGTYFIVQNEGAKYVMILDTIKEQFLPFGGLSIIEYGKRTPKLKGSKAQFTDDEKYILIKREEEGHTYFSFYKTESRSTLFYEIPISNRDTKSIEHKILKNTLIITQYSDQNMQDLREISIYNIPERVIIASYQELYDGYVFLSKETSDLVILDLVLSDQNEKIIAYDIAKRKELASKELGEEEAYYGISLLGNFINCRNKNKSHALNLYHTPTMRLVMARENVTNYHFGSREDGEETILIMTTEGTLETYNLTQLAANLS